ncbi:unnamed protein product [Bursaphelenchus okinawaensis]|uniref:Uncharacterized protein n=1 Tax=Bursaphelenchus okinawaensis TaxID=465554 RepID=A0A811LU79_9BILA|nr:unnamed protein product [Bursaphelenchus okinawaensis]CAG9127833.1 unnamed protein product [Bursaphelenchus okinawaensis]
MVKYIFLCLLEIRLWEKRLGQHAWFYPDELLAKVEASEDGKYQISGTIDYWWSPESYLEIFHTCGGECRKIELTSEKNVTSLELLHVGSDCRAKLKSPK